MNFIQKWLRKATSEQYLRCYYCGNKEKTVFAIFDLEDNTYHDACEVCKEEANSEAQKIMGAPQTTSTAIVPVAKTTQTSRYCKSCSILITSADENEKYCKKCKGFMENLQWWSDNHEKGQRFWNIDPYEAANKHDLSVREVVQRLGLWYINIDALRQYCTADEEWFWTLPRAVKTDVGTKAHPSEYTFIDNGSNILFVAHLDKSRGSLDRSIFAYYEGDTTHKHYVFNGNLDDRLGAFIGHYLLPKQFGIKCDVLFTTDEETGGSTAEEFQRDWLALPEEKRKKYNWIIEFDRHDTEPVMYEFEDKELRERVEEFIKTTKGSFTDICKLNKMGCKAINWSTGYHAEHTTNHHAVLEETVAVVEAFVKFYNKYKDVHMPHKTVEYANRTSYGSYGAYGIHRSAFGEEAEWYSRFNSEKECGRCGRKVYSLYASPVIDDDRGLCWACRSEVGRGMPLHKENKQKSAFVCSDCGRTDNITVIHKNKTLCMPCYKKGILPLPEEEEPEVDNTIPQPEGGCALCHEYAISYYEIGSQYLCPNCYNGLQG